MVQAATTPIDSSLRGTPQHKATANSVAILLCTYNGAKFLEQQLQSIKHQNHKNWQIWVSDDGSTDATLDVVRRFQRLLPTGTLLVKAGPGKGSTKNFLSLACDRQITARWYAFCDQDDIWEKDKLTRATRWLEGVPVGTPALYCSRTRLVNELGHQIGYSPLFTKAPNFKNALLQNIANGNTMVFNQAAMDLLREAGANLEVVIHDWWLYLVVTSCGGKVFYDAQPSIRYRQHASNLIGANDRVRQRLSRLKSLWNGNYKIWNHTNIRSLRNISARITPDNLKVLNHFCAARELTNPLSRLTTLRQLGLYRQTLGGNLSLILGTLLGKI